jgi:hypothetical protein
VLLEPELDPAPVLAFIDQLDADPAAQIGLVIWPRASVDAATFGRFAEEVRRRQGARRAPPFLIAAFHPRVREQPPTDAPSLVPFIRRTPDPTLQLVRARLLEELGRGGRDVSADVARANFRAVQARTPGALDRALRAIHRDRAESYARLLSGGRGDEPPRA